jgi:hypothetical protein
LYLRFPFVFLISADYGFACPHGSNGDLQMATKHNLSGGDNLFVGRAYEATKYATNASKGVPVNLLSRLNLGSPIPLDADSLIKAATAAELPTSGSITYSAGTATTPQDTANVTTASLVDYTGTTNTVLTLDVPRNVTLAVTHSSSIASGTCLVSGFDEYKQPLSELVTIAAAGTSSAYSGKKAFKYIKSITFTASADMQANTINVGHGDVLGLPYKIAAVADVFQVYRNDVKDTSATITAGVTTTASTTTGDTRGTVATGIATDTTSVIVWAAINDPNTVTGLRGATQA